jgi:hypothetical protein
LSTHTKTIAAFFIAITIITQNITWTAWIFIMTLAIIAQIGSLFASNAFITTALSTHTKTIAAFFIAIAIGIDIARTANILFRIALAIFTQIIAIITGDTPSTATFSIIITIEIITALSMAKAIIA